MNVLFVHEVDWLKKVVFEIHIWSELLSSLGQNVYAIDFENEWNKESFFDFGTLRTQVFENVSRTGKNHTTTLLRPGFMKTPFFDRATALFTHYLEIAKVIKDKQIDVIILYSVPTNGYQTIKLAQKYGIPVIFRSIDTLHTLVPNRALRPITLSLEKWVYKHADKILTLSPKLSEYVIDLGAEKDKVEMLPFCVDVNIFSPTVDVAELEQELGLNKENKTVVFIGTLFEFCGVDSYIEQFPKILEAIPEAKLVIVGGGALFASLKKLITTLGLEKNIVLTGFKSFSMMPQFINLSDVCINPFLINATTREIIPGKIIQYLACGKPVLATPLPGMVSLLSGPEHGIVYSDIDQFAENTIMLLKDNDLAKSIGKNGYKYVNKNHDEQKIAHRLFVILNQMANKSLRENEV